MVQPITIAASDLVEDLASDQTLARLPTDAAIYFWKLRLAPPDEVSDYDADGWRRHLDRLSSIPQGRLPSVRFSHSIRAEQIVVGGGGLTQDKRNTLYSVVSTFQGARAVRRFLEQVQDQVPAMYVGETGNLRRRIKQHLSGDSDFALEVVRDGGFSWDDLVLGYCSLGSEQSDEVSEEPAADTTKVRRALEYLAAELTIANYTKRPG
jgi:hypothetical protein